MSAVFLENLMSAHLPYLTAIAANGECRFLALPGADQADAQGFPSKEFAPRTADFMQCSWSAVPYRPFGSEITVAAQVRSEGFYEITVARKINGELVETLPSDRVELRQTIGDAESVIVCEVVSQVNQGNAAWLISAVDLRIEIPAFDYLGGSASQNFESGGVAGGNASQTFTNNGISGGKVY